MGPPFDPIHLADLLSIDVVARADVTDAQTVPLGANRARIEFNPNRPRGRVRYSIAHEIAHTFFPDCADQIRQRARHEEMSGDEWQLEALCNIGAAEILMPFGALPSFTEENVGLEELLLIQRNFDVSTEALLIRVARLVDIPCAMFCASRVETGPHAGRYRIDYMIESRTWSAPRLKGALLPSRTKLNECIAIGYTTTSFETWDERVGELLIESVGIPAYPGSRYPRVVGLVKQQALLDDFEAKPCIQAVRGSATNPGGKGRRFVVQVVNDKTVNWGGGGFAQAVRSRWPEVQEDFRDWAQHHRNALELGNVRIVTLKGGDLSVASIVAQKGYGPSKSPRLRYTALRKGLETVAAAARAEGASLHMPRIASGHAGGEWSVVEDLIRTICCDAGVSVIIYDLPGTVREASSQSELPL